MQKTLAFLDSERGAKILRPYCIRYGDLDKLFYILVKWASSHGVLTEHLEETQLCLLFIEFGLARCVELFKIEELEAKKVVASPLEFCNLNFVFGGIGKCLLEFFKYVGSRAFKLLPAIDLCSSGFWSLLVRGQWLELHKVRRTFSLILCFRNYRMVHLPTPALFMRFLQQCNAKNAY
ncbi:unnamed protein product [Gongylonema pulchrum]|uniref:BACK domain-containing protein n=1 Tax=Gongylonema pulchrum TaxID=637853 RepID=A0A183CYD1_9BILA|nr:unnamed protein product [Gongylonema pulchrum]